jgi:hypothetical protein
LISASSSFERLPSFAAHLSISPSIVLSSDSSPRKIGTAGLLKKYISPPHPTSPSLLRPTGFGGQGLRRAGLCPLPGGERKFMEKDFLKRKIVTATVLSKFLIINYFLPT